MSAAQSSTSLRSLVMAIRAQCAFAGESAKKNDGSIEPGRERKQNGGQSHQDQEASIHSPPADATQVGNGRPVAQVPATVLTGCASPVGTPLPNGRGAGVRAPAAGQKARQAPPERPRPPPVARRATRPLPFGLADSHKAGAQFPSPLVGEGRKGGAGHRAPGRSRPAVHQPRPASRPKPPPRASRARLSRACPITVSDAAPRHDAS